MKLLTARRSGTNFRYRVHLDETKTIEQDGVTVPDPAYTLDQTYGAGPRMGGETVPAYTARLTAFETTARREMKALCVEALAAMQTRAQKPSEIGVALAGEGAAL